MRTAVPIPGESSTISLGGAICFYQSSAGLLCWGCSERTFSMVLRLWHVFRAHVIEFMKAFA